MLYTTNLLRLLIRFQSLYSHDRNVYCVDEGARHNLSPTPVLANRSNHIMSLGTDGLVNIYQLLVKIFPTGGALVNDTVNIYTGRRRAEQGYSRVVNILL